MIEQDDTEAHQTEIVKNLLNKKKIKFFLITLRKLYLEIVPSLLVNANGWTGTFRSAEPSLSVKLNL